jgi:hypothetical protein
LYIVERTNNQKYRKYDGEQQSLVIHIGRLVVDPAECFLILQHGFIICRFHGLLVEEGMFEQQVFSL